MTTVIVADDHTVVRRGILQILQDASDITVVGEASSGRHVLELLRQQPCDVLVLDIAMPDGGAFDVLEKLRNLNSQTRVLIFSIYPEREYAVRALKAGASGYLTKTSASGELIDAIRRIAQGQHYVSSSLAERLATVLTGDGQTAPHETLSEREHQVMCELAKGKTVSEIASHLSLSVKTVSTYRRRLLEKLDLRNTAEIIRYALEHGIVGKS